MTENREYLKNLWHYSNSRLSSDNNKSYKHIGCFRQHDFINKKIRFLNDGGVSI